MKWATKPVAIVLYTLLLSSEMVLGQQTILFDYKSPRTGKAITASGYLGDFASRSRVQTPGCYYAMGWYKFHVRQTAVIDSIAFYGDIHPELRALGEKSIRESQVYWQCSTCEKTGGHWFTIPIFIAYTVSKPCASNPIYDQSVALWNSLFRDKSSEQIAVGPNEWLLAPMYSFMMR